jgi:hypothetical protein
MNGVPGDTRLVVSPEEYRIGLRWWMGVPLLSNPGTCPACGEPADCHGDHFVCCNRNNYYGRHFAVQEGLMGLLAAGGQGYRREVALSDSSTGGALLRPADLLLTAFEGGTDLAIDLTVVHPVRRDTTATRTALQIAEDTKTRLYGKACRKEGWAFTVLGFTTWGGTSGKGSRLLHRLLRRAAADVPFPMRPCILDAYRNNLSVALMRQVWRQLSAASTLPSAC